MVFTKQKHCPRCSGINFSRLRPPLLIRWLMPNTRRYHCHGCHSKLYLLPSSGRALSTAEAVNYQQNPK